MDYRRIFGFFSIFSLLSTLHCIPFKSTAIYRLLFTGQPTLLTLKTENQVNVDAAYWSPNVVFGMIGREPETDGLIKPQDAGFFFQTNYQDWGCRLSRKILNELDDTELGLNGEGYGEAFQKYIIKGCLKALEDAVEAWTNEGPFPVQFIAGEYVGPVNSKGKRLSDPAILRAGELFLEKFHMKGLTKIYDLSRLKGTSKDLGMIAITRNQDSKEDEQLAQTTVYIYSSGYGAQSGKPGNKRKTYGVRPAMILRLSRNLGCNVNGDIVSPVDARVFCSGTVQEVDESIRILASKEISRV